LPIATEGNFEVTFTLPKFQPATVPVTVTRVPGDFTTAAHTTVNPSPVTAELQAVAPPRRARPHRAAKKRATAPAAAPAAAAPAAPAPAAAAPAAGSPFPNPQ